MAKRFDTIAHGLQDFNNTVKKQTPHLIAALGLQLAKDAKEQKRAPDSTGVTYAGGYKTTTPGALTDSSLKTPTTYLEKGIVMWETPYSVKRYYENNLNPDKKEWDIKTWDANYTTYEEQVVTGLEKEIFK